MTNMNSILQQAVVSKLLSYGWTSEGSGLIKKNRGLKWSSKGYPIIIDGDSTQRVKFSQLLNFDDEVYGDIAMEFFITE